MLSELLLLPVLALPLAAQCPSTWDATVGAPGANFGVRAFATFDDGTGPRLFAAGDFTQIGGVAASRIARWDGTSWSALGAGLDGRVEALAVYDDGSGSALYAGGFFAHAGGSPAAGIARWNGVAWSPLGAGIDGVAFALAVHDDGAGFGRTLFVGGSFAHAGGIAGGPLARWSAAGWSSVPSIQGGIEDLAVHDSGLGGGPVLYACGFFPASTVTHGFRSWNGTAWSELPAGAPDVGGIDDAARTLCSWNDGTGSALYVGGSFWSGNIARFDGVGWSTLANGVSFGDFARVEDLIVHDDGGGRALWATGYFQLAGGVLARSLARWNGASWSAPDDGLQLGAQIGYATALASHDDGHGRALYVGGDFDRCGAVLSREVARRSAAGGLPVVGAPTGPTSAAVGDVVQFTVVASGVGPLSYEWRAPLGASTSGADSPTLSVQVTTFAQGEYLVLVRDACGRTSSTSAHLAVSAGPGTPVCACYALAPCGNQAQAFGQGCTNSLGRSGWLAAQGIASASADSLVLLGANMTNSSALYFQGTTTVGTGGAAFGDGVLCAGGSVARLGVHANVGGASSHPRPGDVPLSIAGGLVGGETRIYQVWYRDAAASYCTSATFNVTNGVRIVWSP